MISSWRISKRRYANPPSAAFDGEGSRRVGGRWSGPGTRVAYASSTLSLAALEYFVNLSPGDAPADLVSVRVDLAVDLQVESLGVGSLPVGWQSRPFPTMLQEIGRRWVAAGKSVGLFVPSVIIPQERNLLLNPVHADFGKLVFHDPEPFVFDLRMWK